jgi:hypothetical protein
MAHTNESPLTELGYYAYDDGQRAWQVILEANETSEPAFYHLDGGATRIIWDVPPGHAVARTPMGLPLTVLSPDERAKLVFISPMQKGSHDEQ